MATKKTTSAVKKSTTAKAGGKKKRSADGAPLHPALHGFAKRGRNYGDGKPCAKHAIFAIWLKNPATFDIDAIVDSKKYKKRDGTPIKRSTIASWVSNWKAGLSADGKSGGFYPVTVVSAAGSEAKAAATIKAALAKLAKASKKTVKA